MPAITPVNRQEAWHVTCYGRKSTLSAYAQSVPSGTRVDTQRTGDRLAFGLLVVFGVLMYAIPSEWIDSLSDIRLALFTSAAAMGLMVMRRLFKLQPFYLDGARGLALIAFTGLGVASISWSVYPEGARFSSGELVKSLAIYLTMINVVTTRRRLIVLCAALVFASVVTSIGAINWYRAGVNLVETYRTRWLGVFSDPNYLAMNVGVMVPLAVAFALRRGSSWAFRIACATAGVLALITIVLSHSRGGLLGLATAMVVWAFREKRRLQAIMLGVGLMIGLLLFAPGTFWQRSESIGGFREDASALGRIHAWEVGVKMNMDHPLLGVGVGSFLYAWPLYAPSTAKVAHVAHNVFLDIVAELGFIGLLLFLVFLGGAAGGAFQAVRDPHMAWLTRAIAASVVAYLTCSLFLSGYSLSAHLYMICGLAACADRITRRPEVTPARSRTRVRGPWEAFAPDPRTASRQPAGT